jgi:hypothetical protein
VRGLYTLDELRRRYGFTDEYLRRTVAAWREHAAAGDPMPRRILLGRRHVRCGHALVEARLYVTLQPPWAPRRRTRRSLPACASSASAPRAPRRESASSRRGASTCGFAHGGAAEVSATCSLCRGESQ